MARRERHQLRRRPWARLTIAALLLLAVPVTIAALTVQAVLRTDYPRRLVEQSLQDATGLRVSAGSLQTGWTGRTTLRDVTFRLPLGDTPILTAPVVHVRHRNLPWLLAGRGIDLRALDLRRPTLRLLEQRPGAWNFQEAQERISAASAAQGGPTSLPQIEITQGTVEILRHDGRQLTLPLEFHGAPDGGLLWEFTAASGDSLKASGKIAPRADWAHQLTFTASRLEPLAALFIDDAPSPLSVSGSWRGQLSGAGLSGWAALDHVRAAALSVAGTAALHAGDGTARVDPQRLRIDHPSLPAGRVDAVGGAVRLSDGGLRWNGVRIESPGLAGQLSGSWEPAAETIRAQASWRAKKGPLAHDGSADVTLHAPGVGRMAIQGRAESTGRFDGQEWDLRGVLDLKGATWSTLEGSVLLPRAILQTREGPVDLSGLSASFQSNWPETRLTSLDIPRTRSSRGSGRFNAATGEWELTLDADRLDARPVVPQQVSASLRATGTPASMELSRLEITGDAGSLHAKGTYIQDRETPLLADIAFRFRAETMPAPELTPHSATAWTGGATVSGALEPLHLRVDGLVRARDVPLGPRTLELVEVPIHAEIREDEVSLTATNVDLLAGRAQVAATYDPISQHARARLGVTGLQLRSASDLYAPAAQAGGQLSAELDISLPGLDLQKIQVDGEWMVSDFTSPAGSAAEARGRITTSGERVSITDVEARNGEGRLTGMVEFDIADRPILDVTARATRWPVAVDGSPLRLVLDGVADAQVHTETAAATGTITIDLDAMSGRETVGRASLEATLDGRTIRAERLRAEVAGGIVHGHATIPLDDWSQSFGRIELADIRLTQVAGWLPRLDGLAGTMHGTIQAGPSVIPLAPAPMRVDVLLNGDDLAYRRLALDDLTLVAYVGPRTVQLDLSTLHAAGGAVEFWSRLSWHGEEPFLHISADAKGLSLDQLVRCADPDIGDTPGLLDARANIGGYLGLPHRAYGAAHVTVQTADLGHVPVISRIFSLLRLRPEKTPPVERTTATFRLEGDALELSRLHHFSRGADVVASGTVANIWLGADSPVSGVAAGAVRPLRNLRVPFGRNLDSLIRAFQSNAVSVRISGTLGNHQTEVVPFSEVTDSIGRLLGGGGN